jgi:dephospho-CoA kinase
MIIVGLTGGIGSGKSTVAGMFAKRGIQSIDLDIVARQVVEPSQPALATIFEHFAPVIPNIVLADSEWNSSKVNNTEPNSNCAHKNQLNRAALRDYIFQHSAEKKWLEDLLHPLIYQRAAIEMKALTSPYVVLVSPPLAPAHDIDTNGVKAPTVQATGQPTVQATIAIDIDEPTQIARASQRDNNTPEQIRRIMASQQSRAERNAHADFIIDNSFSLSHTEQQVEKVHQAILALFSL